MTKNIDIGTASRRELCDAARKDAGVLKQLVEMTEGDDRRARQRAAGGINALSQVQPELLVPYAGELIDALHRPEAKTRWDVLEALTNIIDVDARAVDKAVGGAEASLYDEESGPARLAAFRFLALYGATTENRAERVWHNLDEALQCYHGDTEYQDMLVATVTFAGGKASADVKKQLVDRMSFDADNSRGPLGRYAQQIVETAKGR